METGLSHRFVSAVDLEKGLVSKDDAANMFDGGLGSARLQIMARSALQCFPLHPVALDPVDYGASRTSNRGASTSLLLLLAVKLIGNPRLVHLPRRPILWRHGSFNTSLRPTKGPLITI